MLRKQPTRANTGLPENLPKRIFVVKREHRNSVIVNSKLGKINPADFTYRDLLGEGAFGKVRLCQIDDPTKLEMPEASVEDTQSSSSEDKCPSPEKIQSPSKPAASLDQLAP